MIWRIRHIPVLEYKFDHKCREICQAIVRHSDKILTTAYVLFNRSLFSYQLLQVRWFDGSF